MNPASLLALDAAALFDLPRPAAACRIVVAMSGGVDSSVVAALAAAAFAEAARIERQESSVPKGQWLLSRRTAIWLAIPFAIGGWWSAYLGLAALYAAISFFTVQHMRHRLDTGDRN